MHRYIEMMDERERKARVVLRSPKRKTSHVWQGPDEERVQSTRLITAPEGYTEENLMARYGSKDALAKALLHGDPEIDPELVGRQIGDTDRVWIRPDQTMMYSSRLLEVITDPNGEEKERRDFEDTESSVAQGRALAWSGRLMPIHEVLRKYVLGRKVQVRHTNAMTFDFLHDMATKLEAEQQMLLVGGGQHGLDPLILQRNGTPQRGFLEGRTNDQGGFMLLLHLSNLELKEVGS